MIELPGAEQTSPRNDDPTEEPASEAIGGDNKCNRSTVVKTSIASIVIGFIIFVIVDSTEEQHVVRTTRAFLSWVEENSVAGVFSFTAVYFLATVLFIPGSILTLGSGYIFANVFGLGIGVLLATTAVFLGASAGAIAAFFLGRYLLRDQTEKLSNRYTIFRAIDLALLNNGLKIMFLLRLSPLIPFNAINYILGVTGVAARDYIIACIGMLPGTVLYVFLGSSAGSIVDSASSGQGNRVISIISIVGGVVFGVLGILATSYYAKKELNKFVQEENSEVDDDSIINEVSDLNEATRRNP